MTPREKRERLFRTSRPYFREFELYDGSDYHKDLKILWVAHKNAPFYGIDKDLNEYQFIEYIKLNTAEIVIVEDDNKQYADQGPIGVVTILNNGWKIEPHVEFFPWATPRNKLRSVVGFMQWARSSRKIGCVMAYSLNESKPLFDRACTYGVLHYVGKISNGDPRGDEYLFSVKGKKR